MARSRYNIRLADAVEKYLARLQSEGQSAATVHSARHALGRFQRAAGNRREPDPFLHTLTAAMLDDYCYGPGGIRQGIRAVTFNRYRSVLRGFFEYAQLHRWVDINPMAAVLPARPEQAQPKLRLNAGELLALLDHCGNPLERVACALAMNTGLRSNDLIHLTIFDVSLASGVIQTEIRKTKKLDVKPITADLQPELTAWLDTYAELTGRTRDTLENDWLLLPAYRPPAPHESCRQIKLRPLAVLTAPHRLAQRPLRRMGYPTKGEGFHTLRRSSARVLFEMLREAGEGKDHALMVVQDYLNHSNTIQTQRYLGLNEERTIRDSLLRDRPFLSNVRSTEQERVTQDPLRKVAGWPGKS